MTGLVFCCYVEIMMMSSNNNNFFLPLFTVLFRKFCRHLLLDNTERRPVPVREPGNAEHTAESPHHHVLDADPRHPHLLLPPSLRALLRDTGVHAPPRHSGHHWYIRRQVYSNTNFLSMVPKIYSNSKQFVNTRRILHKFQSCDCSDPNKCLQQIKLPSSLKHAHLFLSSLNTYDPTILHMYFYHMWII